MALSVTSWNVTPNRVWFVRLADAGTNISVELYLSQADAEAQLNRQASGSTTGFGSDLPVTLTNDQAATYPVSLFQSIHSWHLKLAGSDGDPAKIFRVKEFVDLDEISHPLFRNADLIELRARAEIDAHTHARIPKQVDIGSHMTTLEPGEVLRLNSTRRGKDEKLQVLEHRITAETNDEGDTRVTSSIATATFLALKR